MHAAIRNMLNKYRCESEQDYTNALKEIFQEIALLGLWRAKFFEKAAFYGGSSLRILYNLNRFSEDLDFTLLKPTKNFDLATYNQAVADELASFGFRVTVDTKNKNINSAIESAFIKGESKKQLIVIEAPIELVNKIHHMKAIKIKMEVDTDPPGEFETEVRNLLQPIPFSVKTLILPDLFAGKVHAILCRPWQKRVKGRDWYDFVWYIARNTPVNLIHLRERLIQSKVWDRKRTFKKKNLIDLLSTKIEDTNFKNAKKDILPFIEDRHAIELWSESFFGELLSQIKTIPKE